MAVDRAMMFVPLLAAVAYAAASDAASRRIPNHLTFALALAGLGQGLSPWGVTTLGASACGLVAGLGLTLVGYVLGGMKAGDVKLSAAVGAWVGPVGALAVFAVAAVTGLAFVVGQGLWERRLGRIGRDAWVMVFNLAHVRQLGRAHVAEVGARHGASATLPYAVFALAGTGAVVAAHVAGMKGVTP
jgi:prepilin peptidase CpaA